MKKLPAAVLVLLLLASARGLSGLQFVTYKDPEHSSPAEVLSPDELARLRPVVEQDLKEVVKRVYNEDAPTPADLDEVFNGCRVAKFDLGKLGRAILVEGIGLPAPNMAMLNVYVPTKKSYRLVMAGTGFGPYVVPSKEGIPYLIFGGTVGAGTEKLYRFHYSRTKHKYQVDACDDHQSENLVCRGQNLPTFPDPLPLEHGDQ